MCLSSTLQLFRTDMRQCSLSGKISPDAADDSAGQGAGLQAALASQQDSTVAAGSQSAGLTTGMPDVPGGLNGTFDWAVHAVASRMQHQAQQPHQGAPILASSHRSAAPQALPKLAAAARQGEQHAAPSLATAREQHVVQQTSVAASARQQVAQLRPEQASSAPAARPPQHPQGGSRRIKPMLWLIIADAALPKCSTHQVKMSCRCEYQCLKAQSM